MYIQHSSNTAVRSTQFAECEEVFFIAAGDKKILYNTWVHGAWKFCDISITNTVIICVKIWWQKIDMEVPTVLW